MKEVIEKRTLDSKTFDLGGGKFKLHQYRTPIHFVNQEGQLEDIDATIVDGGLFFEVAKTEFPLRVKKNFTANNFLRYINKIGDEQHLITVEPSVLAWVNAKNLADRVVVSAPQSVTGVASGNKITFTGAYGAGIDFEITILSTGFRKEIVFQNADVVASRPSPAHRLVLLAEFDTGAVPVKFRREKESDADVDVSVDENNADFTENETGFEIGQNKKTYIQRGSIVDNDLNSVDIRLFFRRINDRRFLGKVIPVDFFQNASFPVRADSTTTGAINQDNWLDNNQPTKNWNNQLGFFRVGDQGGGDGARGIARLTMPADPGGGVTIDKVEAFFKVRAVTSNGTSINVHHGTTTPCTTWNESQSTWNQYSSGNNWTAGGGASDFSATIVDTYVSATADDETFISWVLYGTGATNPITITWGDVVNLLFRAPSSAGFQLDLYHDEDATNKGYLSIEYSVHTADQNSAFLAVL